MADREDRQGRFTTHLRKYFEDWQRGPLAPVPVRGTAAAQIDFANWLRVDPGAVSNWLRGRMTPGESTARKVSDKVGPWVLQDLGYPLMLPRNPFVERAVLEMMALPPKNQETVMLEIIEKRRQLDAKHKGVEEAIPALA